MLKPLEKGRGRVLSVGLIVSDDHELGIIVILINFSSCLRLGEANGAERNEWSTGENSTQGVWGNPSPI